jgi:hypothetical protein
MSKRFIILGFVSSMTMIGCGGSDTTSGSCTINAASKTCVEILDAPSTDVIQQLCSQIQAASSQAQVTFAASPCSRDGAVGECKNTTNGHMTTTWSYAPTDAATAEQACAQTQGTFVSP